MLFFYPGMLPPLQFGFCHESCIEFAVALVATGDSGADGTPALVVQ